METKIRTEYREGCEVSFYNGKAHFYYVYQPTDVGEVLVYGEKHRMKWENITATGCLYWMRIKPVRLGRAHWDDYESRHPSDHNHDGFIVRETQSGNVFCDPTHPLVADVLADAEHYAHDMDDMLDGDDDGSGRSLINSAKTTAKNLTAALNSTEVN